MYKVKIRPCSSLLYRYCGNDWANKRDPMGLASDDNTTMTARNLTSLETASHSLNHGAIDKAFNEAVKQHEARSVDAKKADVDSYNK